MHKNQPKINISIKPLWKYLDLLSIFCFGFILSYIYTKYPNLPEQIATHFDQSGNADAYGSKTTIWIMPIVSIVMFAILYITSKYPHKFNYIVKITQENALSQYNIAIEMMVYLRFIMVLIFSYLTYMTIELGQNNDSKIGMLPLWTLMLFIGFIIIRSIYLSNKYK